MIDGLNKINELRLERGWTIYRLADEAGVTQSTLANMIARNSTPSIRTLEQLCCAFGITLAEFFSEDNDTSQEDLTLLSNFRKLDKNEQEVVLKMISGLTKNN